MPRLGLVSGITDSDGMSKDQQSCPLHVGVSISTFFTCSKANSSNRTVPYDQTQSPNLPIRFSLRKFSI